MKLTPQDRARVTAAVTEAELSTDAEIVTIVAGESDSYRDAALHYAVLDMLLPLAVLAAWPQIAERIYERFSDGWNAAAPPGALFAIALVLLTLVFLAAQLAFRWAPLRIALTPGGTKARRVRRRALMLFRTSAEKRTRASTGVLLYLSLAERRAEIVADESIHAKVSADVWGAAMAALIVAVRDGRPGDGMADAVAQIGLVCAEHFPRSEDDTNELPDRLIEL